MLHTWQLEPLLDSCQLAVSEMVTNAVRHGAPPLDMQMRRSLHEMRVSVQDGNPVTTLLTPDRLAMTDLDAENGRGLGIVNAVADHCGVEPVPGDGKRVYASWDIDTE